MSEETPIDGKTFPNNLLRPLRRMNNYVRRPSMRQFTLAALLLSVSVAAASSMAIAKEPAVANGIRLAAEENEKTTVSAILGGG